MYHLYELLPMVLRLRDNLYASGGTGMVEKAIGVLEDEAATVESQVTGLTAFPDPDSVSLTMLPFLIHLVAGEVDGAWTEEKRRMVARGMVALWMRSGQHLSWRARLQAFGETADDGWELWKAHVNEDGGDYSPYQDYDHPYKAARVRFVHPTSGYVPVSAADARTAWDRIEVVRPIHVIPLVDQPQTALDDALTMPTDVVSATLSVTFADTATVLDDDDLATIGPCVVGAGLQMDISCATLCEATCQSGCTTVCESVCQGGSCESACTAYCQVSCMTACQAGCQTACEIGACQDACMTGAVVSP